MAELEVTEYIVVFQKIYDFNNITKYFYRKIIAIYLYNVLNDNFYTKEKYEEISEECYNFLLQLDNTVEIDPIHVVIELEYDSDKDDKTTIVNAKNKTEQKKKTKTVRKNKTDKDNLI